MTFQNGISETLNCLVPHHRCNGEHSKALALHAFFGEIVGNLVILFLFIRHACNRFGPHNTVVKSPIATFRVPPFYQGKYRPSLFVYVILSPSSPAVANLQSIIAPTLGWLPLPPLKPVALSPRQQALNLNGSSLYLTA